MVNKMNQKSEGIIRQDLSISLGRAQLCSLKQALARDVELSTDTTGVKL